MSIFYPDSPYGLTIGLNPASGPAANYTHWSQLFADMAALGLTWLRFQLSWKIIQLAQTDPPSAWAWGALDDAVAHCNAQGINMLFPIRGAPTWALTNTSMQATTEPFYLPDPTMYAYFAQQVALRYNGVTINPNTGLPYGTLQSIEFGNEDFNIHHTPPSGGYLGLHNSPYAEYNGLSAITFGIEPARDPYWFANILPAAAAAVRASAAPGCLIGMAAIWWRSHPNTADFITGLYAQVTNAATLLDYLNLHFYSNNLDPSTAGSGATYAPSLAQAIADINGSATTAGDGNKKIWITEIGWNVYQVNTTVAAALSATGSQTVTPASMKNITVGKSLSIDPTGTAETVTVSSITGSTFTATFTHTHSAGYIVQTSADDCDAPTQASRYSATLATARTSGPVGKIFPFTLDYGTTGFSSCSLVQYGWITPGVYGNLPAYSTLQSFIAANPQWGIIPTAGSLSFSAPGTQTVSLRNGGANGNWSAVVTTSSGGSWLSTNTTSGTLATDATQNVTVTVSSLANSLAPGTYIGTITYTVNGFITTLSVTLTIGGSGTDGINVSTSTLTYNGVAGTSDPAIQSVTITNSGTTSGAWSASSNVAWATPLNNKGTLAMGATQSVSILVSNLLGWLRAGTYTGVITYTRGTASVSVTLTLVVAAPTAPTSSAQVVTLSKTTKMTLYQNDTLPLISLAMTDDTGAILPLTGLSATAITMKLLSNTTPAARQTTILCTGVWSIPNASGGIARYQWVPTDTLLAGEYLTDIIVQTASGPLHLDPYIIEILPIT